MAPGCTLESGTLPGSLHLERVSFSLVGFNNHISFKLQFCFPPALESNVNIRPGMHIHFVNGGL
jgi:hypothetical protein